MSALLLKVSPYLAAATLVFGVGWYAGGMAPKAALARLQAVDWQAKAQGEEAARKAVQAQLAQAQAVSANNSATIERLQNENAQIAADRDGTLTRVRRLEQLLVVASRPSAPGAVVSQTGGGQGATGAGGDTGPTEVERLLVDAKEEAERNARRLDALIAEINPQL